MNRITTLLETVRDSESELQTLVDLSEKTELGQCIRLLSVYLALYRKRYGDLSEHQCVEILDRPDVNPETAVIFNRGIREAIDVLAMVLQSGGPGCRSNHVSIN